MMKKLIIGGLGLAIAVGGIAVFTANTAQWVNITAHVEKEIEVACVDTRGLVRDCDYGVVFPQNDHERIVEVTTSNSFENQDTKSAIKYWILWECKQDVDDFDGDGDVLECRTDLEDEVVFNPDHGKWTHPGFFEGRSGPLDGNLRDYISIAASSASCFSDYSGAPDFPKDIVGIADGSVGLVESKCFYNLVFTPPTCEGHFNPFTDPAPGVNPFDPDTWPPTVPCHEMLDSEDPQDWDRFWEGGDNFKIQVYGFTLE
jgi:hypothetical protein